MTNESEKWCYPKIFFHVPILVVSVVMGGLTVAKWNNVQFDKIQHDLKDLIGNWEMSPITDIYFSNTSACPTGYTSAFSTPEWPGSNSSACACPDGASYTSSSTSKCDKFSKKDDGCRKQMPFNSIELTEWRDINICVERDSKPQLISDTKTRPTAKDSGNCEIGYTACGSGSYDGERTTCVPEGSTCPITGIEASSSVPSNYEDENKQTTNDGVNWYFRSEYVNEMPINEFKLALYVPGKKRGICFRNNSQQKYVFEWASYTYQPYYPDQCEHVDNRWSPVDYQSESSFLLDNFEETSYCTDYPSASDYIENGTRCSESSPNDDPNCMMYGRASTQLAANGCDDNDYICQNIYYQSNCGGLKRFATQSTDKYWAVMGRHEIYWKSNCDVSMQDVKMMYDDGLSSIQTATIVNMAFTALGYHLSFVCMIFHGANCDPGKGGNVELKLNYLIRNYFMLLIGILKIIPVIVALVYVGRANSFSSSALNCGTGRTNAIFESMSSISSSSLAYLIVQLVFEFIGILIAFFIYPMPAGIIIPRRDQGNLRLEMR